MQGRFGACSRRLDGRMTVGVGRVDLHQPTLTDIDGGRVTRMSSGCDRRLSDGRRQRLLAQARDVASGQGGLADTLQASGGDARGALAVLVPDGI